MASAINEIDQEPSKTIQNDPDRAPIDQEPSETVRDDPDQPPKWQFGNKLLEG